jgi:hypothetical protein
VKGGSSTRKQKPPTITSDVQALQKVLDSTCLFALLIANRFYEQQKDAWYHFLEEALFQCQDLVHTLLGLKRNGTSPR